VDLMDAKFYGFRRISGLVYRRLQLNLQDLVLLLGAGQEE
jgi:hypothetical protein